MSPTSTASSDALHSTVGQSKAEVTARRCRDISPSCRHPPHLRHLRRRPSGGFLLRRRYDYIADCHRSGDLQAGPDPRQAMDRRIPILSALGTGNKLDPTLLRVTDISRDQRLPAGPCHAEGTAQPWHPPPEGGVQPGAARRHYPAGGPVPRPPQRPGQCAMGPLHRRYPAGRHHCAGSASDRGGDIAGLLIRQARLQRDWSLGRSVPWHLRPLLSVQDRAGQGRPLPGGDGAAAAPAGSCLELRSRRA